MGSYFSKIKAYVPYIIISLLAIVWNLLTMHNSLPWCDEVMLVDTPANMYFYGEWATTAYNQMGEGTIPFATYMPLYIWVIYGWIVLFGFSFLKVRMCEIVTTFILGFAILRLLKVYREKQLSPFAMIIFSLGFWFTDIMSLTYRMARPDMLGALMAFLLFIYIVKSLKYSHRKYICQILLFSGLSIIAGLQSGIFVIASLLFACLFVRPVKQMVRPFLYVIAGFVAGMVVAFAYMACFGEAKAYAFAIIDASATLHSLWLSARGIILPLLGKTVREIPVAVANDESASFVKNTIEIFTFIGFFLLFILMVVLHIFNKPILKIKERKLSIILALFSVYIIFFFNLAGRYQTYYMWTAAIPVLLSVVLFIDDEVSKICGGLVCLVIALGAFVSIRNMGSIFGDTYDRIVSFVKKQNFKSDSSIGTVFSTYYALKPQFKNAYWYEVYPISRVKNFEYIIFPNPQKDKLHYKYVTLGSMQLKMEQLKSDSAYSVKMIDTMIEPSLSIYSIKKK